MRIQASAQAQPFTPREAERVQTPEFIRVCNELIRRSTTVTATTRAEQVVIWGQAADIPFLARNSLAQDWVGLGPREVLS